MRHTSNYYAPDYGMPHGSSKAALDYDAAYAAGEELSRAEMRSGRVIFMPDYERPADRSARKTEEMRARAFIKSQDEHLRAYGINDRALVVDENFWRGLKVALGFTVVMTSLLALVGYRLFS